MRPVMIAVAAVVLLGALAAVGLILRSNGPAGRGADSGVDSGARATITSDLLDAVRRLDASTRELTAGIERLGRRLDSTNAAPENEGARGTQPAPLPKNEVTALTRAMQTLNESLRAIPARVSTASGPSLRKAAEPRVQANATDLKGRWASDQAASRSQLLKSYAEVLRELGPPERIFGQNESRWRYRNGQVVFYDGLVGWVDLDGVR